MPVVQIQLLEGRSAKQKATLIHEVTEAIVHAIEAPRESIRVLIQELPKENFGIAGKTAKALGK